jgi:hypothetical protein
MFSSLGHPCLHAIADGRFHQEAKGQSEHGQKDFRVYVHGHAHQRSQAKSEERRPPEKITCFVGIRVTRKHSHFAILLRHHFYQWGIHGILLFS